MTSGLAKVLGRASESVLDCLVYLEYEMPDSSSRADVVIAGLDVNGYRSAVVIELHRRLVLEVGSGVEEPWRLLTPDLAPHYLP